MMRLIYQLQNYQCVTKPDQVTCYKEWQRFSSVWVAELLVPVH